MNLRIEEIRYENIRNFGNLTLDFTKPGTTEPYDVSLVQMPNGTGKTTTMGLIRHLILGTQLDGDAVSEYEPDTGASEGEFAITFAAGDDRFRVHMQLDYIMETLTYRHSYPQREGGGMSSGHYLPLALQSILTEEFTDLFVFDGELPDKFIETGEDEAEQALKIVNRLDRVDAQRESIETIVDEFQQEKGAKTKQGLKQFKTKADKRSKKLRELRTTREELENAVQNHEDEINSLTEEREEIISNDKEALEEYKELESEIKGLQSALQTESNAIIEDMRLPSKLSGDFYTDFEELLTHMKILRLPKSTSKEFFVELADEPTCVCGRDLDENHRKEIRQNAERFLSDEDVGVLNSIKQRLGNVSEPASLESRLDDLSETRDDLKEYEMRQAQLNLSDENLESKKQDLTRQIEKQKTQKERKERKIELLSTDDKGLRQKHDLDWQNNIPAAKREASKYEEKVEEATNTVEFSTQAKKLESIFGEFVDRTIQSVKQSQIRKTNQRLDRILKRSSVQIHSIDDSIKIRNKSGISEGQSLAVAYAYLSTLFENSAVDMPFVIDSPAVSLDHKVRAEVAPIITTLFDQVLAFIISTEKPGFVENLQPDTEAGINYYTVYQTGTPSGLATNTERDFFLEFTSEEEEPDTAPAREPGASRSE